MLDVLIGIQSRSGSTRLPRKAWELISGRTMLDRCIESASHAAKNLSKRGINTDVVVITPEKDPIVAEYSTRANVVEGPEFDVLTRYALAVTKYPCRYLVRVTGDCPLIPSYVINEIIKIALRNETDYIGNCDDRFRTSIDGTDTEVLSSKMLHWLNSNAESSYDREHVTTLARRSPPHWAKVATVLGSFDLSDIKLSVDTREDLDKVKDAFQRAHGKYQDAVRRLGAGNVFRL